jgi:predicted naringenin-chalcone synthase
MPAFISSIGTAVPDYVTDQKSIGDYMIQHLSLNDDDARKLRLLYRATGIQQRHSILPDFNAAHEETLLFNKLSFPSVRQRMNLFREEARKLSKKAVCETIDPDQYNQITHLVTVSCTGMYAPGLDIDLIEDLGLPTNVERTAINFMGCYAAFIALKTASQIVLSNPEAHVLVVCVELCSIHFQSEQDEDTLLSNALFGDGAAAMLITSGGHNERELELRAFYNDLALEGKSEMGWFIGDYGFEMKLTATVPKVIQKGIVALTHRLFDKLDLTLNEVHHFAIHPGGKRILKVIEEALDISRDKAIYSHEVLRSFGNMSSPTVIFVIQSLLKDLEGSHHLENILSFAFGPGLTMESMILTIHERS